MAWELVVFTKGNGMTLCLHWLVHYCFQGKSIGYKYIETWSSNYNIPPLQSNLKITLENKKKKYEIPAPFGKQQNF